MYMEDLTARIEMVMNGTTIGHMNSEIDETLMFTSALLSVSYP